MNISTSNTSRNESIALFFKQGTSDKVYQVQLVEHKDGCVVNFQYGRRGSSLVGGTKTLHPMPYHRAKRVYDSLVSSKRSKGYQVGKGEIPYTSPVMRREEAGFFPQLMNRIEEEEALELFGKHDIWMQIKHDGERRGVLFSPDGFIGANRKGLKVPLNKNILKELERWHGSNRSSGFLDTEDMGDHLVIFDAVYDGEGPVPFAERAQALADIRLQMHQLRLTDLVVDEPYHPPTKGDMLLFILDARNNGEEGVVIRSGSGVYVPGKPNSGGPVWKLKFYEDATCMVDSIHPTKRSVSLVLQDENRQWVDVGNCTIPPNHEFPKVRDLVEIRYLYAYRDGSLYQPQYKGVRTDVEISAALTSQLKYKT